MKKQLRKKLIAVITAAMLFCSCVPVLGAGTENSAAATVQETAKESDVTVKTNAETTVKTEEKTEAKSEGNKEEKTEGKTEEKAAADKEATKEEKSSKAVTPKTTGEETKAAKETVKEETETVDEETETTVKKAEITVKETVEDAAAEIAAEANKDEELSETNAVEGMFEYKVNADGATVTITKYKGNWENGIDINIPKTLGGKKVTKIGSYAFKGWFATVCMSENVTNIESYAFADAYISDLKLNHGLKTIGDYAFEGAVRGSVTIPSSVQKIGKGAFAENIYLEEVKINSSATQIGADAFKNARGLVTVEAPLKVFLRAGKGTRYFTGCTYFKKFILTGNAPKVTNLESTLKEVFSVSATAAKPADGFTLYYGNGVTGYTTPKWNGIPCYSTSSIFDGDFEYTVNPDGKTVTAVGYRGYKTTVNIPETLGGKKVTAIAEADDMEKNGFAHTFFSTCPVDVKEVIIPYSITEIGFAAFAYFNGTMKIVNPNTDCYGGYAFFDSSITKLEAPIELLLKENNKYFFQDFEDLKTIVMTGNAPAENLEEYFKTQLFILYPDSDANVNLYENLTLYYYPDATGYTTPIWNGMPCYPLKEEDINPPADNEKVGPITYVKGTAGGAVFRADDSGGHIGSFEGLEFVDLWYDVKGADGFTERKEMTVNPIFYEISADKKALTIKEEFLNTLEARLYGVTFGFEDGGSFWGVNIVEGDGSYQTPTMTASYVKGENGMITMRSERAFDGFTGVRMDGLEVDPANYVARSGSTIVTFKKEYLDTLSEGEHKVEFVYVDGVEEGSLSIIQKDSENNGGISGAVNSETSNSGEGNNGEANNGVEAGNAGGGVISPKTADSSNILIWLILLLVTGTGLLYKVAYDRKRKQ